MAAMTCSATGSLPMPPWFTTSTPAAVHASTSTASNPATREPTASRSGQSASNSASTAISRSESR